jgi:ketosteroid isomerase-like protein
VSQENVEVVRRALTTYFVEQPPDVDALHGLLAPDCVITTNWGADEAVYRGVRGALAARAEMTEIWDSWHQVGHLDRPPTTCRP